MKSLYCDVEEKVNVRMLEAEWKSLVMCVELWLASDITWGKHEGLANLAKERIMSALEVKAFKLSKTGGG